MATQLEEQPDNGISGQVGNLRRLRSLINSVFHKHSPGKFTFVTAFVIAAVYISYRNMFNGLVWDHPVLFLLSCCLLTYANLMVRRQTLIRSRSTFLDDLQAPGSRSKSKFKRFCRHVGKGHGKADASVFMNGKLAQRTEGRRGVPITRVVYLRLGKRYSLKGFVKDVNSGRGLCVKFPLLAYFPLSRSSTWEAIFPKDEKNSSFSLCLDLIHATGSPTDGTTTNRGRGRGFTNWWTSIALSEVRHACKGKWECAIKRKKDCSWIHFLHCYAIMFLPASGYFAHFQVSDAGSAATEAP